jgi:hypothetical protein
MKSIWPMFFAALLLGCRPLPAPVSAPSPVTAEALAAPVSARILDKDSKLGCTWVEAEASVRMGENESPAQVKAAAVDKARQAAMKEVLGVELTHRSLDFQQEGLNGQTALIESVLKTTRRGRILQEELLADGPVGWNYFVKTRACFKEKPEGADGGFRVELSLSRDAFFDGDQGKISVESSRDAFLYLYDVQSNGETSLIAPNEWSPEVRAKAGEAWEYPDPAALKAGARLQAQMPLGGAPISAETIRVVATKTPLPKKIYDPAKGGWLEVMQRLNGSDLEYEDDAKAFTISPRSGR